MAYGLGDAPVKRRGIRPPKKKDKWGGRPARESGGENRPADEATDAYTGPDLSGGGFSQVDPIDFDALLAADPRVITSKASRDENIAAAKLAKENAIKKAMLALGMTQADIAKQAGYQQADLSPELAGRGMLRSGAYGGGTRRIEENRAKALAAANQTTQDNITGATQAEADAIRQFNQAYEEALAEAAAALAEDPRYQTPKTIPEATKPKSGGGSGGGAKPPKAKKPKLTKKTKDRLKAGRM